MYPISHASMISAVEGAANRHMEYAPINRRFIKVFYRFAFDDHIGIKKLPQYGCHMTIKGGIDCVYIIKSLDGVFFAGAISGKDITILARSKITDFTSFLDYH